MYQLRIFESDNAMTQVGRLRFRTRDDMYDVFTFLFWNNENNKWEFELVDNLGEQIDYYEYGEFTWKIWLQQQMIVIYF